jgi:hypothetical protein
MKTLLMVMAILISISAYHLFVVDKLYLKYSSVAVLDINSILMKLEDDLYADKLTTAEYKEKTEIIRDRLEGENGLVLNSSGVVKGTFRDLTPEYMQLVR